MPSDIVGDLLPAVCNYQALCSPEGSPKTVPLQGQELVQGGCANLGCLAQNNDLVDLATE